MHRRILPRLSSTSTTRTTTSASSHNRLHFASRTPGHYNRHMGGTSSTHEPQDMETINTWNTENKIMIYSKTYCPYCVKAKDLIANKYPSEWATQTKVVELDTMGAKGASIQSALLEMTGQSTVPSVFINAKHIGGCDDTHRLHQSGELDKLIKQEK